jgi:hypothetical protein
MGTSWDEPILPLRRRRACPDSPIFVLSAPAPAQRRQRFGGAGDRRLSQMGETQARMHKASPNL